ncbi:tyrosine-type recombinase/integrase [Chishuiella sp.]|uniref:tyrosine-type recombinase/integrase n=1 Tax=Chishuiella sp. TaxID=1969467 RepID=UPI0028A90D39|nr:tyrosine-type recombinase/integrase [Chishuiella sp.]
MKNSFSVSTKLRKEKGDAKGRYLINYSVYFNKKTLKLPAKVKLPLSEWDFEKDCPKGVGNSILKKKLKQGENRLHDILLTIDLSGKPMTSELIKEMYDGDISKKDFFYFFDDFCKKKFPTLSEGTQYHYLLFRKQLKEYKTNICLEEINIRFIEDFLYYLSTEKKIGNSGIATRRKHFSVVLNKLVVDKIIKENPCKHIPKPKEKSKTVFLTSKEIERIEKANLKLLNNTKGLELTRNLFLFSCYTGLRYSDVINLKKENIIDNKKIVLEMKKTRRIVEIPLNHWAFKILANFKIEDKKTNDFVFNSKENAPVNRDLKTIAKIAKIDKVLTFHVARHSFGSMLAKNGVQPFYIMKLMGHKDIRMTERYVNSDEEILTNVMNKVNF